MLYTGTLMTENAFYPLFLAVALAARARCSSGRRRCGSVALLALCARRVRDARAGGRARRRGRDRAAAARLVERRGARGAAAVRAALRRSSPAARCSRSLGDGRARPLAARRCSAPTARRPTSSYTRRQRPATTSSTTSPSSTSTSASSRSPRCSRSGSRRATLPPAARAFAAASLPLVVLARARGRGLRLAAVVSGSRSGTCSTSRRSPSSRCSGSRSTRGRAAAARGRCVAAAVVAGGAAGRRPVQRASSTTSAVSDTLRAAAVVVGCRTTVIHARRGALGGARRRARCRARCFLLVPRRYALVLPLRSSRVYFVADARASSRTAATGSTRLPRLALRRASRVAAPRLDRPRRRPRRVRRRALDSRTMRRRTPSGRTSSSTAASARVYDVDGPDARRPARDAACTTARRRRSRPAGSRPRQYVLAVAARSTSTGTPLAARRRRAWRSTASTGRSCC